MKRYVLILVVFFVVLRYYYHDIKAEKNIITLWSRKQEKNTDCKRKPGELTTLTKPILMIPMNMNLLSNPRKPKQQETFSLPDWKNSFIKKY